MNLPYRSRHTPCAVSPQNENSGRHTARAGYRWGRERLLLVLLAVAVFLSCRASWGADAGQPAGSLYERARQASVELLVEDRLHGSGWFADPSGLVVTVAHMFDRPGRRTEVLSPAAGRIDAELIALDRGFDLALLRVKPREGGYPTLPFARAIPAPGEDVFLIGAPMFRHGVLLRGSIARSDSTFEYYGNVQAYAEIVHVSGNAPHGMSGGPWMNRAGEVVGMQSGVMVNKDAPAVIAFMTPLEAVRRIVENRRNAETPTLGLAVEETWQQQPDFLKRLPPRTEGLVVKILHDNGPAARAGLKQNEVIVAIDGRKVRLPDELLRYVRARKPGQTATLTILGPDGTGQRDVAVELGKLEAGWEPAK
jgi:serine protease Do